MTDTGKVETHLIDALRDYAQGEEPARDDDEAVVDAVLARLENEPVVTREGRNLQLGLTISAAALASAAAVALWLAWPRPGLEEPTQIVAADRVAEPAPAEEAVVEPEEAPAQEPIVEEKAIVRASAGRACFRVGEQPQRCVEPGTSIALPRFSDAGPVVLTVVIGELQLTTADGVLRRVGAGERVQLAGAPTVEKIDPDAAEAAQVGTKARVPAVGELLERALAQRTAGRVDAAARTYRELIRLHPKSSAARTALVSLGQVELTKRPAAALRSFERYLAGGKGVLREEASYGRARALRRLGRKQAERTAIERYLIDHPDGMYAAQLRSRLASITKEAKQ
jgi:hypothetical protein